MMMTRVQRLIQVLSLLSSVLYTYAFTANAPRTFKNGVLRSIHVSATKLCAAEKNPKDGTSRRDVLTKAAAVATSAVAVPPSIAKNTKSRTTGYTVQKSETEWRSVLSATQYEILRRGGTERPYSSILEGEERPGIYACAGCGTKLFDPSEKFHSGTGWPSFARALDGVEVEKVDSAVGLLIGAELRCKTCGGHLGDVFGDGFLFKDTPAFVSGKRYCIDGAALVFQPENGEPEVVGDKAPTAQEAEQSLPDWLTPPEITPRSR